MSLIVGFIIFHYLGRIQKSICLLSPDRRTWEKRWDMKILLVDTHLFWETSNKDFFKCGLSYTIKYSLTNYIIINPLTTLWKFFWAKTSYPEYFPGQNILGQNIRAETSVAKTSVHRFQVYDFSEQKSAQCFKRDLRPSGC